MYGCDCHIGCLTGAITRIGKELEGVITQIGSGGIPSLGLSGSISRVGKELEGVITQIGSGGIPSLGLSGSISRVGSGFNGYVSMVCTVSKDAYLEVSTDVLWLTPDMLGEEFEIYSNVDWKID